MSKKFKIFFTVFIFVAYALYSFALVPIYSMLCNDIIYSSTYLPELIEVLFSSLEIAVFVLLYSTLIYVSVTESFKSARIYLFVYLLGMLFKNAANLLINTILSGYFNTTLVFSLLGNIAIELILLCFVILIAKSASRDFAYNDKKREYIFPFKKIVSFSNPVQKSLFLCALVIGMPKILSRIIYDISYGAPELREIPLMLAYYTFDIVVAVIGYFALIWTTLTLDKKSIGNKE